MSFTVSRVAYSDTASGDDTVLTIGSALPADEARSLPGVEHVATEEGTVTLTTRAPAPVLSALAARDALSGLQVRGATLEDVFLHLTGREYRA